MYRYIAGKNISICVDHNDEEEKRVVELMFQCYMFHKTELHEFRLWAFFITVYQGPKVSGALAHRMP